MRNDGDVCIRFGRRYSEQNEFRRQQASPTNNLMKRIFALATACAAMLLCSCIPSVNPFYTGKDVIFDARLAGEWHEKDAESEDHEIWKFEKADTNDFRLTVSEKKGKTGQFTARLFKLKQDLFLDLLPADCSYATNQADLVAASMFPGHLLLRVSAIEPELQIAFFDSDWLQKHLEQNPKTLAHHNEGDRIILTAETKDLQQFVLSHLNDGLFDKPGEFVRKSN